jgi:hypothetical protein
MISDNWLCKRYDKVNGLSMCSMDRYTQALFSANGPQHRRKLIKYFWRRMMMSNRLQFMITLIGTIMLTFVTNSVEADIIISTFDSDAEGWTLTSGGGTLTWLPTGGNPDGYINIQDDVAGFLSAFAPSQFLGNLSEFDDGLLSMDIILLKEAIGIPHDQFGLVTITGNSGSASLDMVPGTPATNWVTYAAPLTASNWGVTQSTWESILSDVIEISVIVDSYDFYGDTIGFDNFEVTPVPAPGAVLLGSIGLALAGWKLRRRKEL